MKVQEYKEKLISIVKDMEREYGVVEYVRIIRQNSPFNKMEFKVEIEL